MLTSIQRFDHSRRDGHELPSVSHHGYETGEAMDFDQQVSKQVSKLLQSYGSDAMTCLDTLASLIKDRLDQHEARKA